MFDAMREEKGKVLRCLGMNRSVLGAVIVRVLSTMIQASSREEEKCKTRFYGNGI